MNVHWRNILPGITGSLSFFAAVVVALGYLTRHPSLLALPDPLWPVSGIVFLCLLGYALLHLDTRPLLLPTVLAAASWWLIVITVLSEGADTAPHQPAALCFIGLILTILNSGWFIDSDPADDMLPIAGFSIIILTALLFCLASTRPISTQAYLLAGVATIQAIVRLNHLYSGTTKDFLDGVFQDGKRRVVNHVPFLLLAGLLLLTGGAKPMMLLASLYVPLLLVSPDSWPRAAVLAFGTLVAFSYNVAAFQPLLAVFHDPRRTQLEAEAGLEKLTELEFSWQQDTQRDQKKLNEVFHQLAAAEEANRFVEAISDEQAIKTYLETCEVCAFKAEATDLIALFEEQRILETLQDSNAAAP